MELIRSKVLEEAGFAHGFTSRDGGSSEGAYSSLNLAFDVGDEPSRVAANMEALQGAIAFDGPIARLKQIHGATAIDAGSAVLPSFGETPSIEGDALVCDGEKTLLAIQTADCAAVLIADPVTRVVAAVHAGWRGAAGGVIRNAIKMMRNYGCEIPRLVAAVGPCICQKCYEVGEEVAKRLPESSDPVRGRRDKFLLDLPYAVEVSLLGAGMTSANIEVLGLCTACDDRFFSYRGSGGTCGRNLGFIASEG